jgi:hypothetical protein
VREADDEELASDTFDPAVFEPTLEEEALS